MHPSAFGGWPLAKLEWPRLQNRSGVLYMLIARRLRRLPYKPLLSLLPLIVLLVVFRPKLVSAARTELAGLAFDRGLVMLRQRPQEPNPYLDRALRQYQAALALDPGNVQAWRKLGELYLLLGQNQAALDALARAVALRPRQPFLRVLLGDAYDGLGMARQALAEWKQARAGIWRQDQISVNLMKIADAHVQTGDLLSAIPVLRDELLPRDPGNLFALATIVSAYDSAVGGRHPLADPFRDSIVHFDLGSLRLSPDPRYSEFQARALVELYRYGYWDGTTAANVVDYWAWQGHPGALAAARLLRELEPDREEWLALTAQSLVETNRCSEAVEALGSLGPGASASLRRVGAQAWLCVARQGEVVADWERAAAALTSYRSSAPEDLFAIAGLAEAHGHLGHTGESERYVALYERLTDRAERIAASQVLGVDVQDVVFGPNLVANGEFEHWLADRPRSWAWSLMAGGTDFAPALFVGGSDGGYSPSGSPSARVQGLWLQQAPGVGPARAGFWQWDEASAQLGSIRLTPGAVHVVSLNYLTLDISSGAPSVWLSTGGSGCWANDRGLASTGGEWRHMLAICGPVPATAEPVQPLVRLFGTGTVLFDDVLIREAIVLP